MTTPTKQQQTQTNEPAKQPTLPARFQLDKLQRSTAKNRKRIGRGIGSKHGKTAGRGHKGQRARSGHKIGFAFEGGQTPFYRRLPKRGFKNINRIVYHPLALQKIIQLNVAEINPEVLYKANLLSHLKQKYKILGPAKLPTACLIRAHKISKSAHAALLAAGGKFKPLT